MNQGLQVTGFVIRHSLLPAGHLDADPFESQGANDGIASFAFGDFLTIERSGPDRERNRVLRIFKKRLEIKLGTLPSAMDPGGFSATLGDRSDARERLDGAGIAANASDPSRRPQSKRGAMTVPCAGETIEDRRVGMRGEGLCKLLVECGDGASQVPNHAGQRLNGQHRRGHDTQGLRSMARPWRWHPSVGQ